ncbi:hypothetical protein [Mesoplasma melaleucae]|uniref:Transmembrane protein n=1 Tax=Mesoplasma melaleucae TaxID=81459 RepID=A0A2K8NWR1_9MOLU|nr:hypothetical protein [Mesoplasma melaleucae]ATZ18207.1 hypothetical protein EMELA_v1c07090 [Mesoplasma melaleucae]
MKSVFKKTLNIAIYTLVSAYLVVALLLSFEIIKIRHINMGNAIVGKVNGTLLFVLFGILTFQILKFIFENENAFQRGINIELLLKKENLKGLLKLTILVLPFIIIKLVRYSFVSFFADSLPDSIQVAAILFSIMGIIILLIFIYVLLIYIFKKEWFIEQNEDLDFELWIKIYTPQNISNNECGEEIELIFNVFVRFFLMYIIKTIVLKFNLLKSKFIKIDRMRNVPPTNLI